MGGATRGDAGIIIMKRVVVMPWDATGTQWASIVMRRVVGNLLTMLHAQIPLIL
jgi:hypothetical protein